MERGRGRGRGRRKGSKPPRPDRRQLGESKLEHSCRQRNYWQQQTENQSAEAAEFHGERQADHRDADLPWQVSRQSHIAVQRPHNTVSGSENSVTFVGGDTFDNVPTYGEHLRQQRLGLPEVNRLDADDVSQALELQRWRQQSRQAHKEAYQGKLAAEAAKPRRHGVREVHSGGEFASYYLERGCYQCGCCEKKLATAQKVHEHIARRHISYRTFGEPEQAPYCDNTSEDEEPNSQQGDLRSLLALTAKPSKALQEAQVAEIATRFIQCHTAEKKAERSILVAQRRKTDANKLSEETRLRRERQEEILRKSREEDKLRRDEEESSRLREQRAAIKRKKEEIRVEEIARKKRKEDRRLKQDRKDVKLQKQYDVVLKAEKTPANEAGKADKAKKVDKADGVAKKGEPKKVFNPVTAPQPSGPNLELLNRFEEDSKKEDADPRKNGDGYMKPPTPGNFGLKKVEWEPEAVDDLNRYEDLGATNFEADTPGLQGMLEVLGQIPAIQEALTLNGSQVNETDRSVLTAPSTSAATSGRQEEQEKLELAVAKSLEQIQPEKASSKHRSKELIGETSSDSSDSSSSSSSSESD